MKRFFLIPVLISLFLFTGCRIEEKFEDNTENFREAELTYINLAPPFNDRDKEYSGLTWYNDNLVLLPQYIFGRDSQSEKGYLFTIKKSVVSDYLNNPAKYAAIVPDTIQVFGKGLSRFNRHGSGYESIGFIGNNVYFTIESIGEPTRTFIVKGVIDDSGKNINIDSTTLTPIPLQTNILNIGYETMVIYDDKIIVINEANGADISANPKAFVFNKNLQLISSLRMPHIEYRITDATYAEGDEFYAMNYFWVGDRNDLKPADDSIAVEYGIPAYQSPDVGIERILSFVIENNQIKLSGKAPIYWKVIPGEGRNWEGIVKFDERGFLIVTDTFPRSILSFVKID